MKNKFIKILLILLISLIFSSRVFADDFNFTVKELEVYENGNLIKGKNGGTVTTNNGDIIITANNFEYNKLTNILIAKGNVKLVDLIENITIKSNEVHYLKNVEEVFTIGISEAFNNIDIEIYADDYFRYNKSTTLLEARGNVVINDLASNSTIKSNEVFYLKNEDKFYTKGKTKAFVSQEYTVNTSDLIFLRKKGLLSSGYKTTIEDTLDNFYTLSEFEYSLINKILKGNNIELITNFLKPKSETFFFKTGFFDLINSKFIAKDIKITFDKMMYDNKENDPRATGITGSGDEYNTYLNKASFTTCKKTDKCPPWLIKSEKVRHDKIKKRIIYKDAWLKLYDVPIIYFPKFFHPDPTVKRQSGFLKPNLISSDTLGVSLTVPYFYTISDQSDMTIKPRIYDNDKYILQSEFRQKTKKTYTHADFSYLRGYQSSFLDTDSKDSRTHLFTKTFVDLEFDSFLRSDLQIQYQRVSNDMYLKLFDLESPLLKTDISSLESYIKLDIEKENTNFTSSFQIFESLSGTHSDRYQYVFPTYSYSRLFYPEKLDGSFTFSSGGSNELANTNILSTDISNDLIYNSYDSFLDNGIKHNYKIFLKNLNSIGKRHAVYKNSPQSEGMTGYMFNMSLPLIKKNSTITNLLEPKLSLQFSPHEMKDISNTNNRINASNVYSFNRLGSGSTFEEGASLTVGFDFIKQKEVEKFDSQGNLQSLEIEDFFEMKLATVLRDDKMEKISPYSTVNRRGSNIFGLINYNLSEYVSLNYDFSIDNDLSTLEYSSIDTKFTYKKFSTSFTWLEENGELGSSNLIDNITKLSFDNNNSLLFKTRKDRQKNLTEYYDLIYKYELDCLTAGLQYRKKYYEDADIKPSETLFFTLTIIPLGDFSPDNLLP
jgi:LPS-assembly protein